MAVITLTTDFGYRDSYVAEMKGVLVSICPSAQIVDICHQVPPCDILAGAQVLFDCFKRFPSGTIHLAVIDPGVGTSRKALAISSHTTAGANHTFVGPDNGLFSLAAPEEQIKQVVEITHFDLLPAVEQLTTFDGRDVFAPVAALIASGRSLTYFGKSINPKEIVRITSPLATVETSDSSAKVINGEVVYIDGYGNLISNISKQQIDCLLPGKVEIALAGQSKSVALYCNYQQIPVDSLGGIINSKGRLEISISRQSAEAVTGSAVGTKITVVSRS